MEYASNKKIIMLMVWSILAIVWFFFLMDYTYNQINKSRHSQTIQVSARVLDSWTTMRCSKNVCIDTPSHEVLYLEEPFKNDVEVIYTRHSYPKNQVIMVSKTQSHWSMIIYIISNISSLFVVVGLIMSFQFF